MEKLFIFVFLLLSIIGFSQDLDGKKEKLDEIQEKISKQQKLIEKTENKKKETKQNLNSMQNKKKDIDQKIKKLQKSENKVKDELNATKSNLKNTSEKVNNLNELCQKEFRILCKTHFRSELFPSYTKDAVLLAELIKNTASEINSYNEQKDNLEKTKNKEQKEFENVQWSRIVAKKKSKNYQNEMGELASNISRLEKEKKQALAQKEKLEKEAAALNELISKLQAEIITKDYTYQFSTPKLIWPLKGEIIKNFGINKSSSYNVSTVNNGIDISAVDGTEVRAVDKGVVAFAEWHGGSGKLVIIDHQNGFFSLYSHNSAILVLQGERISRNQTIALSGQTGSVDIPCLHFELRKRGNPVDPLEYLE